MPEHTGPGFGFPPPAGHPIPLRELWPWPAQPRNEGLRRIRLAVGT